MPTDRYGLALTTTSVDAREAYVEGCDLALTFYPGAEAAFDRALAADPRFAMAHAAKAQTLARQGDVAAAREALATAREFASGLSEREASHIAFFELVFSGSTEAAIAALYPHLKAWPRDAPVVSVAANPNGLLGASGRIGQKRQIAELMDGLAPHYGDDFWFLSYHAMALSEDGRFAPARALIERSIAANLENAHAAHGFAHISYETGALDEARSFLSSWLPDYPQDGFFHGHLSWHLSLCEIEAGDWEGATQLYRDGIALERHSGGPPLKTSDIAAFLWRSELAGYPRDMAAWRALHEYIGRELPMPAGGLADLHVILAQAVMGDDAGLAARSRQMEDMAREGRYPSGAYLPTLAPGFLAFERGDFAGAIEALTPLAGQSERIGGSRAQHDLIDFTLLKACLEAKRLEEARHLLQSRRPGAANVPVMGVAAIG